MDSQSSAASPALSRGLDVTDIAKHQHKVHLFSQLRGLTRPFSRSISGFLQINQTKSLIAMLSAILAIIHVPQAAFSSYNLHLASISIRNLQGYEETSKKAAEYSNIAEYQLHKTRTTQASGTLAVFLPSPQVYPKFTHKSGPPLTRELAVPYCVLFPF